MPVIVLTVTYQEAIERSVTFDEEDPALIGRMIQFLYRGDYGTPELDADLAQLLDRALNDGGGGDDDRLTNHHSVKQAALLQPSLQTHTLMHTLADRFDIPSLQMGAADRFVACIQMPELSHDALLDTIDLVYAPTRLQLPLSLSCFTSSENTLRKHAVFQAQCRILQLRRLPRFLDLFASTPSFAIDFATKYAARQHVWCMACKGWSRIPGTCTCGFNGMCGKNRLCDGGPSWGTLRCHACHQAGMLVRDEPVDEGGMPETVNGDSSESGDVGEDRKPGRKRKAI